MVKKITTGEFLTNTYLLIENQKCIVVDPGLHFSQYAQQIKQEYEVIAVLITHGHLDHIDGISYFDVPIYFPKLDEKFLKDDRLSLYAPFFKKKTFLLEQKHIILVEDGTEFNLLKYHFKVIHTPGHTIGSVCYFCEEGLFCGDTLFHLSVGRTDFPTGDYNQLQQSLKKLIAMIPSKTILYPGHQELTTMEKECDENPYLRI